MNLSKHAYVNLLHILIIVPVIIWIYVKSINKELTDTICQPFLYVGVIGILYHIYLCSKKLMENRECWRCWVNYIHIFLVFPLFIYIGYNCAETERRYFEMLLLLGIAAGGYHVMNLVRYG